MEPLLQQPTERDNLQPALTLRVVRHDLARYPPTVNNTARRTTGGTRRCRCLQTALSVVRQQNLWYYHIITWILQVAVLLALAFLSGQTDSALGLTQRTVSAIVCIEIFEAVMTLFVLSGVLVHIKDRQWHTSDLAWLWLVTTVVFAALYMTIAISYDSLLCGGTQPCTYLNETNSKHLHIRRVPMPQLTSNVSFVYPDVWLKKYSENITLPHKGHHNHLFTQMRLEMKHGVRGAILLFLQFWYYSVQMQTQVGVGDVIPVCWLARSVAMVQMLVGILFSATLVSLTLDSFRRKRKTLKMARREQLRRLSASVGRRSMPRYTNRTPAADDMSFDSLLEQADVEPPTQSIRDASDFGATVFSSDGSDDDEEEEVVEEETDNGSENTNKNVDHGDHGDHGQYTHHVANGVLGDATPDNSGNVSENPDARSALHPTSPKRSTPHPHTQQKGRVNYTTPTRRTSSYNSSVTGSSSRAIPQSSALLSAPLSPSSSSSSVGWGTWLCGRSATSNLRAVRRFMRRWLLLVTLAGQALHLFWLYIVDDELFSGSRGKNHRAFTGNTTLALVSMFIQILLVLSVVATALVYVRHSERITLNYLCQAFLSICIHFSGIYIMIFLFQGKLSWPTIGVAEDNVNGDSGGISVRNEGFWGTSLRFLYISIVLMTTTGCNSLSPKSEIAIAAVTVQMIVSFLFLAVILALGVSLVNSERSKSRKEEHK
jgi:hypothetical protein